MKNGAEVLLTTGDLQLLTDRDDLVAVLDGHSRSEVRESVLATGPDLVVAQVIKVLNGDAAPRGDMPEDAVVQWFVSAPGATDHTSFFFLIEQWHFAAVPGVAEQAKATVTIDIADFLFLMAGQLDVVRAFLSRRLRVTGDVMFARTIESWFER